MAEIPPEGNTPTGPAAPEPPPILSDVYGVQRLPDGSLTILMSPDNEGDLVAVYSLLGKLGARLTKLEDVKHLQVQIKLLKDELAAKKQELADENYFEGII